MGRWLCVGWRLRAVWSGGAPACHQCAANQAMLLVCVQLEETEYELREIEQFRQLARVTS